MCCVDYSKPWQVFSCELEMQLVGYITGSAHTFTLVHSKVVQRLKKIPPMWAEEGNASAEREESLQGEFGKAKEEWSIT